MQSTQVTTIQTKTGASGPTEDRPLGMAEGFYKENCHTREPYLCRARNLSELTMPTLFRPEGENGSSDTVVPWNSLGAYLVNNLTSKVIFALFPAGRPNFKAGQDKSSLASLRELPEEERGQIKQIIDAGLSQLEQDVAGAIEEDGDRARMFIAALHLIVGGNHALQIYPDGTLRGIPLDRYVTTRDPSGNLTGFAIEDTLDWETLDDEVRQAITEAGNAPPSEPGSNKPKPVQVYTHGKLVQGKWRIVQEALATKIEGSEATLNKDALNYLFLPWMLLDGEHYGRSYCEMYEGDLQAVEGLTKSIGEGAAALARFITLVNPTGMTDKKNYAQAANGDVITGREQDIHVVTGAKSGDFRVAESTADKALNRLSRAFLLQSTVQRQGERVTAEEIRAVSAELEDGLGGVYSQQTITFQGPYIKIKIKKLQGAGRVQQLPKGAVKITVSEGLAALGRNAELTSLRTFLGILTEALGPEGVKALIKAPGLMKRVATALGIDTEGLVPTQEEFDEQEEAAAQQELITQLGPEALKQAGQNITSNQVADTQAASQAAPPQPQQ